MKKGRVKFRDFLGKEGINYDNWIDNHPAGYYLTYKQNFYADEYDFAIQREGCSFSEPIYLTNNIRTITKAIDEEIRRQNKLKIFGRER